MTHQTSNTEFTRLQIDKVFQALTSVNTKLKYYFDKFLFDEYKGNISERLSYVDIGKIARCLVEKQKKDKQASSRTSSIRLS